MVKFNLRCEIQISVPLEASIIVSLCSLFTRLKIVKKYIMNFFLRSRISISKHGCRPMDITNFFHPYNNTIIGMIVPSLLDDIFTIEKRLFFKNAFVHVFCWKAESGKRDKKIRILKWQNAIITWTSPSSKDIDTHNSQHKCNWWFFSSLKNFISVFDKAIQTFCLWIIK